MLVLKAAYDVKFIAQDIKKQITDKFIEHIAREAIKNFEGEKLLEDSKITLDKQSRGNGDE